jgi:hypothetical protein
VSEQDLTHAIIVAVNASRRASVQRTHSGRVKVKRGWMHLAKIGTADITGFMLDGSARFVALEVKLPGEKPTPEQEAYREEVMAAGGVHAVVRSVDEAVRAVTDRR